MSEPPSFHAPPQRYSRRTNFRIIPTHSRAYRTAQSVRLLLPRWMRFAVRDVATKENPRERG